MIDAIEGRDGKLSTMRIMTVFVCMVTMLTWMTKNVVCMILNCPWVPLDPTAVTLIIGVLVSKAAQVWTENKSLPNDKTQ